MIPVVVKNICDVILEICAKIQISAKGKEKGRDEGNGDTAERGKKTDAVDLCAINKHPQEMG